MAQRDQLTNEHIKKMFKSNFELANYAMRLARYKIASGHETNVDLLLQEIMRNPQQYEIQQLDELTTEAKATHRQSSQEKERR